jgi:hypothetical protein
LAALAHVINQQGTGSELTLKLENLTAHLVAGSAVNAVFPQAAFASAVAAVNSASGVLPASATPPTITLHTLPGNTLNNVIQNGIPNCPQGQVPAPSATGLQCINSGSGPTTPTISGFSPNTGAIGDTVTITGTNLGNFIPAPVVKFGNVTANQGPGGGGYVWSGTTSIQVLVPTGLAAGNHTLTIGGFSGTPMTVGTFTVTAGGGTTLLAPSGVTAVSNFSSQMTLNWSAVAGAAGYRIYRATTANLATTAMTEVTTTGPVTGTMKIDTGLTAGTTYYYKIVAVDAAGVSPASTEVSATTQAGGSANAFPNEAITLPTTRRDPVSSPTIAATDLSSVGGSYTGTTASYETNVLVSDYTTGTMLNSCTLSFAANRTVTLTSGVHTYTQVIDGTNNDYWSPSLTAGEVNTGNLHAGPQTPGAGVTEIGITIGRGKVLSVTADIVADPFTPLTPMTERLTCWMPINRTPGTAGAGWTQWLSYGSASDMPTTVTGTYTGTLISANNVAAPGGSTCQLVVATDGTATFSTTGATTDVSFSAQIAGDKEDRVGYTDASNWNLRAKDISNQIDGTYNVITLQNIAGTMMVTAGQGTVRPLTSAGYACTSVIKQ